MIDERFRGYSIEKLKKDILSGLIVGIIAIPLGMAFAIASGVKPEYGIYTTIIAGILVSLFGGSRFQIAGPTGAFIPLLFSIVATYGYDGLLVAGFMSGIILILMGVFKLGVLIKFIPRPVTIGFTSGIAVVIFTGQISKFLGLEGVESKEYFIENIHEITKNIGTINIYSIIIALICFSLLLLVPKVAPKIPAPLIGIVFSTLIAYFFFQDKVPTIGSAYGEIPSSLPQMKFFDVTPSEVIELIRPAFTIAMLGAIESLLSAVVADGMTNTRHNSNKELVGQGIANMVAPLFGGIPATGAIARTATNIKTGAQSPLSGVIHGVVVLGTLLLLAPYASAIPLASLAPVLMFVAWNMSERHEFIHLLKARTGDSIVLVLTFVLTVFINLVVAVEVGLLLAVIIFVKRMSDVFTIHHVLPSEEGKVVPSAVSSSHFCPQVAMFDVEGSLFFAAAERFVYRVLEVTQYKPKVVVLKMNKLIYLDTTGENNIRSMIARLQKQKCTILISGLHGQPLNLLKKTGLYDEIGEDNFFDHTDCAIKKSVTLISMEKCLGCSHFAFQECEQRCGKMKAPVRRFQKNGESI